MCICMHVSNMHTYTAKNSHYQIGSQKRCLKTLMVNVCTVTMTTMLRAHKTIVCGLWLTCNGPCMHLSKSPKALKPLCNGTGKSPFSSCSYGHGHGHGHGLGHGHGHGHGNCCHLNKFVKEKETKSTAWKALGNLVYARSVFMNEKKSKKKFERLWHFW